jgi:hypothetical protein
MSIRNVQYTKLSDEILKDIFGTGIVPTYEYFISSLTKRMNGNMFGSPMAKFIDAEFMEVTNPTNFNKFFTDISFDISCLFDESVDIYNRVLVDYDYKASLRNRINNRINNINETIDRVSNSNSYYYKNTYNDITNINVSSSNCYFDLREGCVSLKSIDTKTSKIDIRDISTISISSIGSNNSQLSSISNILDDDINSVWTYLISSKDNQMSVDINIRLDAKKVFNALRLTAHSTGTMKASVTFTNGILSEKTLELNKDVEWEFSPIEDDNITIKLVKDKPDEIFQDNNRFLFGIQNLGLYNKQYQNEGLLYTNKIEFLDNDSVVKNIGSFKLESTQETGYDSKILWGYSWNNTDWSAIANGEEISRPITVTSSIYSSSNVYVFNTVTNILNSKTHGQTINNIQYYSLNKTPLPTYKELEVQKGLDQWKLEYYHYFYDSNDVTNLVNDRPPSPIDFLDPRYPAKKDNIFKKYDDKKFTDSLTFTEDIADPENDDRVIHKITSYIYVKSIEEGSDPLVLSRLRNLVLPINGDIFNKTDSSRTKIYINGSQANINKAKNSSGGILTIMNNMWSNFIPTTWINDIKYINISLNPGWNEINIYTNAFSEKDTPTVTNDGKVFYMRSDKSTTDSYRKIYFGDKIFDDLINITNDSGIFGNITAGQLSVIKAKLIAAGGNGAIEWWAERYNMTELSNYEMYYQTPRTNNDVFTVDDGYILINYIPYQEDNFRVKLKTYTDPDKEFIYLRAKLKNNSNNFITPKIYDTKLSMKWDFIDA